MKTRINHRILSLLMAILMTVSILPGTAFAAETTKATETKVWEATGADAVLDIAPVAIPRSRLVAWNFRLHGYSGVGLDGTQLNLKGYYGAEILCKDSTITYRAYTNVADVKPVSAVAVDVASGKTQPIAIGLDNKSVNTKKLADGPYAIDVTFNDGNVSRSWFYVIGKKPYAVDTDNGYTASREVVEEERFLTKKYTLLSVPDADKILQDWIAGQGVTPENSLSLDGITYQYWDGPNTRNDTKRWAALAHEIVPDEYAGLDDSVKVLLLHDWITENLSYDKYLSAILSQKAFIENKSSQSRAFYYKDHSGKYSVWDTRTGMCIDFSNILTIMCRELGIPCNVMDNQIHAWNVVWLDGRWRLFDLTRDVQRMVYGENVNLVTDADQAVCYDGFDLAANVPYPHYYTSGTSRMALDPTSVEKFRTAINGYSLYTKEHIPIMADPELRK